MDETQKHILECPRVYHPYLYCTFIFDLLERPCLGGQMRSPYVYWQTMYRLWDGEEEKESYCIREKPRSIVVLKAKTINECTTCTTKLPCRWRKQGRN